MNAGEGFFDPAGASRLPADRWRDGMLEHGTELVADEVPVALSYNGISHAVMLASPQDLEDFAVGFSLGERIVHDARDIYDIEVDEAVNGIAIEMRIAGGAMLRLKETRRARTGKTGCGLCGVESLERFDDDTFATPIAGTREPGVTPDALHRAMAAMGQRQHLHHATGAVHAAGWANLEGELLCVREDIGRHNALDKLVGALVREGADVTRGFAVVTSRASFEMVQKAARAGFPLLAAISAPTALAVKVAQGAGVTLLGFVRGGRHVVYTHPQRIAPLAG
ncbi:formate dehydrogenase accessory sulfurtransferase FdhD [Massilia yuzhufengensis]|uniref:Sulfur carrier protein FdhD n=1 Tax=Massilia yuzhufengensis TaxID=1164594 RepID=A0A1I1GYG5_9BURK|nr:formate dehydrogenase accessory sulfurtransferase FdhD [Massilia yuzhufengensis]SFC16591.1 FdhD protein/phenylacetyl-CoA:acceptor oxidoreductase accessory protein [Massilia yuzhufengensis]